MELKKCPICGADNSELAKFCYSCGADLGMEQHQSVYEQPVAEYQAQYQDPEMSRTQGVYQVPPQDAPYTQEQYQVPPQDAAYTQGQYQAPPQGYTQEPYHIPPQGNPYAQGPYQMPPQGNPYGPPFMNPIPYGYSQKSKLAAGLLGILLGSFGVHNFYLGYTGKAVAQLLISVLSCGTLAVVSSVWGLIEGIMILTGSINTDGKNVPLTD